MILVYIFAAILAVAIIINAILVATREKLPGISCSSSGQCRNGDCVDGICTQTVCETSDDCKHGSCANGYCYNTNCRFSNECESGEACSSGICIPIGTPCADNKDCFNLSCVGKVCQQCSTDGDCLAGQICNANICKYPETSDFMSTSKERGNVVAIPAYSCPSCVANTPCDDVSPTCPYCVNGFARCTKGELFESCVAGTDCLSGKCGDSPYGQVCVLGTGCAYNYGTTGLPDDTGVCGVNEPFCVRGKCSTVSSDAICGGVGMADDLCQGTVGGSFCVNGRCSGVQGTLGDFCVEGSCLFLGENESMECNNQICTGDF